MGGGFFLGGEFFGDDGRQAGDLGLGLGVVALDGPGLLELALQLLPLGLVLGGYDVEVAVLVGSDVGALAGVLLLDLGGGSVLGLDAFGQIGAGDVYQFAVGLARL